MMIFVNEAYKAKTVYRPYAENLVKMLSCIAPHVCEEMWQLLGHDKTLAMNHGQHMMKRCWNSQN